MELNEYIEAKNHKENFLNEMLVKEYNKGLIEKYPFIKKEFLDNGEYLVGYENTLLDNLPDGWRISFTPDFLEELTETLNKNNLFSSYKLNKCLISYGTLVWEDNTSDEEIKDIIRKYKKIAEKTCVKCGKEAKYSAAEDAQPYCEECTKNFETDDNLNNTISFELISTYNKKMKDFTLQLNSAMDKFVEEYKIKSPMLRPDDKKKLDSVMVKLNEATGKIIDLSRKNLNLSQDKFEVFSDTAIKKLNEAIDAIRKKYFSAIVINNQINIPDSPAKKEEVSPITEENQDKVNIDTNDKIEEINKEINYKLDEQFCNNICAYFDSLKLRISEFYNRKETQNFIEKEKIEIINAAEKGLEMLKEALNSK